MSGGVPRFPLSRPSRPRGPRPSRGPKVPRRRRPRATAPLGDRTADPGGVLRGGARAESISVPAGRVVRVPESVPPSTRPAAHRALGLLALPAGATPAVTGGAGALGGFAVQLAMPLWAGGVPPRTRRTSRRSPDSARTSSWPAGRPPTPPPHTAGPCRTESTASSTRRSSVNPPCPPSATAAEPSSAVPTTAGDPRRPGASGPRRGPPRQSRRARRARWEGRPHAAHGRSAPFGDRETPAGGGRGSRPADRGVPTGRSPRAGPSGPGREPAAWCGPGTSRARPRGRRRDPTSGPGPRPARPPPRGPGPSRCPVPAGVGTRPAASSRAPAARAAAASA